MIAKFTPLVSVSSLIRSGFFSMAEDEPSLPTGDEPDEMEGSTDSEEETELPAPPPLKP